MPPRLKKVESFKLDVEDWISCHSSDDEAFQEAEERASLASFYTARTRATAFSVAAMPDLGTLADVEQALAGLVLEACSEPRLPHDQPEIEERDKRMAKRLRALPPSLAASAVWPKVAQRVSVRVAAQADGSVRLQLRLVPSQAPAPLRPAGSSGGGVDATDLAARLLPDTECSLENYPPLQQASGGGAAPWSAGAEEGEADKRWCMSLAHDASLDPAIPRDQTKRQRHPTGKRGVDTRRSSGGGGFLKRLLAGFRGSSGGGVLPPAATPGLPPHPRARGTATVQELVSELLASSGPPGLAAAAAQSAVMVAGYVQVQQAPAQLAAAPPAMGSPRGLVPPSPRAAQAAAVVHQVTVSIFQSVLRASGSEVTAATASPAASPLTPKRSPRDTSFPASSPQPAQGAQQRDQAPAASPAKPAVVAAAGGGSQPGTPSAQPSASPRVDRDAASPDAAHEPGLAALALLSGLACDATAPAAPGLARPAEEHERQLAQQQPEPLAPGGPSGPRELSAGVGALMAALALAGSADMSDMPALDACESPVVGRGAQALRSPGFAAPALVAASDVDLVAASAAQAQEAVGEEVVAEKDGASAEASDGASAEDEEQAEQEQDPAAAEGAPPAGDRAPVAPGEAAAAGAPVPAALAFAGPVAAAAAAGAAVATASPRTLSKKAYGTVAQVVKKMVPGYRDSALMASTAVTTPRDSSPLKPAAAEPRPPPPAPAAEPAQAAVAVASAPADAAALEAPAQEVAVAAAAAVTETGPASARDAGVSATALATAAAVAETPAPAAAKEEEAVVPTPAVDAPSSSGAGQQEQQQRQQQRQQQAEEGGDGEVVIAQRQAEGEAAAALFVFGGKQASKGKSAVIRPRSAADRTAAPKTAPAEEDEAALPGSARKRKAEVEVLPTAKVPGVGHGSGGASLPAVQAAVLQEAPVVAAAAVEGAVAAKEEASQSERKSTAAEPAPAPTTKPAEAESPKKKGGLFACLGCFSA